ncbi:helix-turn-helix transcriptional regulator [Polycladomyces sp. WAk]|uniref:Helix-turn-helix transcriptional regulator n=2 Tax=Polycladomyces zharkentensis TaxID=2807616 RepID=A0ABS2WFP7_9BACL|nr:helix-turn-helix transcriptional regulator [Polycladomyces sp. WAk]
MYGYEMAKRIRQQSRDLYEMGEGTLYPALKRLENKGWLTSKWKETDGGKRRRYYSVTEDGRKALTRKLERWHFLRRLILQVSREVHS